MSTDVDVFPPSRHCVRPPSRPPPNPAHGVILFLVYMLELRSDALIFVCADSAGPAEQSGEEFCMQ